MRDGAKPWHREPWVWFVISLPAIAVAASFAALGFAIATDDGVVADDYYKQGLAVNQVLRRDQRARELHLSATATFGGDRAGIALRGADGTLSGLRLRLVHPTRSGRDQTVALQRAGGVYIGRMAPANGEPRLLQLEDAASTWRLTGSWDGRGAQAELTPGG